MKLLSIIIYLVDNNCFYPRRLKNIFYKIINLLSKHHKDIKRFYIKLHNTHKIYFLSSLFNLYRNDDIFKEELEFITKQSLIIDDDILKGLAIIINNDMDKQLDRDMLNSVLSSASYFPKTKYFNTINLFELDPDTKDLIRSKINDDNLYLEKKYLLGNAEPLKSEHVDSLYVKTLLATNSYFLLTDCCSLFCSFIDKNNLFIVLGEYLSGLANYKDIVVYHLTSLLNEKINSATQAELNNKLALYNEIKDEEIKRELVNVINRAKLVSSATESEFSKKHKLIDKYNQCYFYKNEDQKEDEYNYIEIIPTIKLKQYGYKDINEFINNLKDLSYKEILPKFDFQLDSTRNELRIKYVVDKSYEELRSSSLPINKNNIKSILDIVDNLYKKSEYYYWRFSRLPLITVKNLLISKDQKAVQFRNIGSMFCPYHLINNNNIRNNDISKIPNIISILIKEIFFQGDQKKTRAFTDKYPKIGLELFLSNVINRLSSKTPYNYSRYSYIIKELNNISINSDVAITNLYFKERVKSKLYNHNSELINWMSICKALNDFYGELAITYKAIDFENIPFTNKIAFNFDLPKNLHYLSKIILNICLNEDNFLRGRIVTTDFVDLLALLNYYAIFCIESASFLKSAINSSKQSKEFPINSDICLKIHDYENKFNLSDVNAVKTLINKDLSGLSVFEPTDNYTLKQLTLFHLLKSYDYEIDGNNIIMNDSGEKDFNTLAYYLLIKLPSLEEKTSQITLQIINGLKNNQDYVIPRDELENIKGDVIKFCIEIKKAAKRKRFKRCSGFINKFPPDYYYRTYYVRESHKTEPNSAYMIPLINKFPSSKTKCSWDMVNNDVINIVVPNERIKKFVNNMSGKKILGKRVTYLYSEKSKLIYDFLIIALFMTSFIFFHQHVSETNQTIFSSTSWWLRFATGSGALCFTVKGMMFDMKHWSKSFGRIMEHIGK